MEVESQDQKSNKSLKLPPKEGIKKSQTQGSGSRRSRSQESSSHLETDSEIKICSKLLKKIDQSSSSSSDNLYSHKKLLKLPNVNLETDVKTRFIETIQMKLFNTENSIRNLVVQELETFLKREENYKYKMDKLHQE